MLLVGLSLPFMLLVGLSLPDQEKFATLYNSIPLARSTNKIGFQQIYDHVFKDTATPPPLKKFQRLLGYLAHISGANESVRLSDHLTQHDFSIDEFFLKSFNFLALPRGDFISRFLFELYGGDSDGMTPKMFSVMCSEMLSFAASTTATGDDETTPFLDSRLVRLVAHSMGEQVPDFIAMMTDPAHAIFNEKMVSFPSLVNAERRLNGEGLYHSATKIQEIFREAFFGNAWWDQKLETFQAIIHTRDVWNHSDLYSFGILGHPIPDDYHDIHFDKKHTIHHEHSRRSTQHHKDKEEHKSKRRNSHKEGHSDRSGTHTSKKEKARRPSVTTRKRATSEEHYGNSKLGKIGEGKDETFCILNEDGDVGPGGLTKAQALSKMPLNMRKAFVEKDLDKLNAIAKFGDIDEKEFTKYMGYAEDAGLWEGSLIKKMSSMIFFGRLNQISAQKDLLY